MEMVLDVYKRPFDPKYPVVCMDESKKQLIAETKIPIAASPEHVAKHDYEYKRCGVCNIFMASEPLAGKRIVKITERKTKNDWAYFLEDIATSYHGADKITLVMDNLNTCVFRSNRPPIPEHSMKLLTPAKQNRYGTNLNSYTLQNMGVG